MRSDRGMVRGRREGVWPRIYRPTRGYRLFLGGLGLVGLGGGLAAVAFALREPAGPIWLGAALGVGFVALGAFLLAALARERVALFEDGTLEVTSLGQGRVRLRPTELAGVRTLDHQGIRYWFFHFRDPARKRFRTGLICERDEHLERWLAALPDLDAVERAAEEAALLAAGPGQERALSRMRLLARVLQGAGWAAAAWGWFWPRPYALAVAALAAVPALAIALLLAGRGLVGLDERRTDPRPSVIVPVLLPGLVLMLRALTDFHVVDDGRLLGWAAGLGLGLTAVFLAADAQLRRRGPAVALALFLAAPLAWGAAAEANVLLDGGSPERHRVRVAGKHVVSGKVTSYKVKLAPFGPLPGGEEAEVSRADHQALEVGGEACVSLFPGWLGARWLAVRRCP